MEPSKKPLNVMVKQMNAHIAVMLKDGCEYRGKMVRCDGYMNIILEGATESRSDQLVANYGKVLLRGNNILYIALEASRR